MGVLSVTCEV